MKHFLLIFSLFITVQSFAGTPYKGTGGKIKDNGSGVYFSLKPTTAHSVTNDTFGLEAVTIKLNHPDLQYLEIYLVDPGGTTYNLYYYNKSGTKFDSTIFSDTGTININIAKAPFRGNYKPNTANLRTCNNGQNPDSTWKLYIRDKYSIVGKGTLLSWYLTFGNNPATDVKLQSSNLPIININTRKNTLSHYATSNTYVDVIYNGPGKRNYLKDSLSYRNYGGVRLHGNTALSFPKLSYSFQIQDSLNNKINASIAGFPKDNDFTLNAQYDDKTLIRNFLAMNAFRDMGHYSSRTQMVELVIDGVYKGVYTLEEKIKISKNRVNISKLSTTAKTGDSITGGYIYKKDFINGQFYGGWYSTILTQCGYQVYYQVAVPSNDSQLAYAQKYLDSFETELNSKTFQDTITGWRKYADETSMVDYFIHCEWTKNVDAFQWSTYFYKDRRSADGGKIHMGPMWDQDLGLGNCTARTGDQTSGWCYQTNCYLNPFWWGKYLKDTTFKNKMRCRWNRLRAGLLNDSCVNRRIDSMVVYLDESQKRNFREWNELGVQTYYNSWLPATYKGETDTMKYWLKARSKWLDKNIPGTCRVDYTRPVVSLTYKDTAFVEVFEHYIDSGITYNDNRDGKNCKIMIRSNIDSTTLGYYQYWYDVFDQSNNKTSVLRIVKVIDTIAPHISLVGGDSVFIYQNSAYADSGYTVADNYDVQCTIDSTGTFTDTKKTGKYTISYQATDQSGNKSNYVTRNITVSIFTGLAGSENNKENFTFSPNPSYGEINIQSNSNTPEVISLEVYNSFGKLLPELSCRFESNAVKTIKFNASSNAGIYLLRLSYGNHLEMKKVLLLK